MSVSLPRVLVGWSITCECGISSVILSSFVCLNKKWAKFAKKINTIMSFQKFILHGPRHEKVKQSALSFPSEMIDVP